MDIQQYYRYAANIALNSSLAAFVPIVFIVCGGIYFSIELPLILIVLPFGLYSMICYQNYLIHQKRSNIVSEIPLTYTPLSEANNLLITFLPAPSLRMLLFAESGVLVGEIRDKRFWWWRWFLPYFIDKMFPKYYELYDGQNQLLAYYQINDRKRLVKILNTRREVIGEFHPKNASALTHNGYITSFDNNHIFFVEASALYPKLVIRNSQRTIVGKLIKGWMPQEWGKKFQDANTPYITFSEELNEKEKIVVLGMLAEYFCYTSH